MDETETPRSAVRGSGSNDLLGHAPERAAFERWFLDRYCYSRAVLTNPIWAREVADAAEAFQAGRSAERERLCAAIKAADDKASEGDYMLDSDDCISVIRGTWSPGA